jgi:hypothetical protein
MFAISLGGMSELVLLGLGEWAEDLLHSQAERLSEANGWLESRILSTLQCRPCRKAHKADSVNYKALMATTSIRSGVFLLLEDTHASIRVESGILTAVAKVDEVGCGVIEKAVRVRSKGRDGATRKRVSVICPRLRPCAVR